ncbi:MAG: acyl-ACP--UDP-N-acetylglucosamine O-acyltransferase [Acidobacteriota bacterium]|jgi:UDP-N-acetylglucosamine acyltransferase
MTDAQIDPTARVDPGAAIGDGVRIGPHCIVGPEVALGPDCTLEASVILHGPSRFGARCRFAPFSSIGSDPQDLKYRGEPTRLEVGDDNTFREFVTVNRGTAGGGGVTRIGAGNFLMAYTHVAHDCTLGDGTILANAATLAGHVTVESGATVGAFSGIHQFCRVGREAFIGGYSVVTQDALPFVKTVGNRARAFGINVIGLQRRGHPAATVEALKRAYRVLFRSKRPLAEALGRVEEDLGDVPEVMEMINFIRSSERGVVR